MVNQLDSSKGCSISLMNFAEDTDLEGELLVEPKPPIIVEADKDRPVNMINWRISEERCREIQSSRFKLPESDDEL